MVKAIKNILPQAVLLHMAVNKKAVSHLVENDRLKEEKSTEQKFLKMKAVWGMK